MDNKFGAMPISAEILAKAGIGLWAFELDEGKPPRMYVNEAMLGLIGLEEQITPEETYHAWYDNIDEGSYGLVADAVEKMMNGEHAEVQYPWHYPGGRTIVVRCGGVRNPAYKKGIRIEGTHQDVTEVLHFDEEKMRSLERQKIELTKSQIRADALAFVSENDPDITRFFNYFGKRIMEISGCDQVIFRNKDGNRLVLHAPDIEDIPAELCAKCPFSNYEGGLYGDDRVAVMDDCSKGFHGVLPHPGCPVKSSLSQRVYFGEKLVGLMSVHYLREQHTFSDDAVDIMKTLADYFGLLLRGIEAKKLAEENNVRMLALEDNFEALYDVNLETEYYTPYVKGDAYAKEVKDKLLTPTNYFENLRPDIDLVVYEPDRDGLYNILTKEALVKRLDENGSFDHYYRVMMGEGPTWFRIRVVYKNSEKKNVIIGVFNAAEEMANRQKEQELLLKKAEESQRLVDSFVEAYDSVYIVKLPDGSLEKAVMSPEILRNARTAQYFSEVREVFLDKLCHPCDKKRMATELSFDTIQAKLTADSSYNVEYCTIKKGATMWNEMRITAIGADKIIIGIAEDDLEIAKHHLEEKRYAEYFAIFAIDLTTEKLRIIKNTGNFKTFATGKAFPYETVIQAFASHLEDEEPKNFFTQISDLNFVRQKLAHEDKYTYSYRSHTYGKGHWIDVTIYVLRRNEDGTPALFTLGFSMVDSLGAERQELHAQLQEALVKAEAANEAKTRFLFNMSHDVRTPMNAILGFTDMALKNIDNKNKVVDCIGKIDKSGKYLLGLINEVLEMSRIESEGVTLNEVPIDVRNHRGPFVAMLQNLAEEKNISLSFENRKLRYNYLYVDALRMDQILVNIISNAIKYSPKGGKVSCLVEHLESSKPGCVRVKYTVRDNGIGISKEFLPKIFEPFSREENSTVSGIMGTGLGLSIVKRLLDLMGGTIEVQSEPGKGTTVIMNVDMRIADKPESEDEKKVTADFTGKKVLLVEDNELNREIAVAVLEEIGLSVDSAEDGDIAVAQVREKGIAYYDFILMDIQMPRMNGYEATREIRKLPGAEKLPIIALSANAFEEDKQKSLDAGMNGHVAKPIDVGVLVATMAKFL